MNQNTETWEERFRNKTQELLNQQTFASMEQRDQDVVPFCQDLESFIRTEIDRARQGGRDEVIDHLLGLLGAGVLMKESDRANLCITVSDLEAARQHKEG